MKAPETIGKRKEEKDVPSSSLFAKAWRQAPRCSVPRFQTLLGIVVVVDVGDGGGGGGGGDDDHDGIGRRCDERLCGDLRTGVDNRM